MQKSQMAKKKSKQQPKQPNMANVSHTATAQTTSQLASTSRDDAHAPATTQISFFDFITLASTEDVKIFLKLASTTPEGKNLENLWRRAHGEGYEKGRKAVLKDLQKKMDDKFEEGVERGMDLGREEGFTVAKEAFDNIIKVVKARQAPEIDASDASTQTDILMTATTSVSTQTKPGSNTSVSCQMQPISISTPSSTTIGIQTNPTMCVAMPQSSELFRDGKNAETLNKNENYCRNSRYFDVFSSVTPSATSLASTTPSTTITASKPRPRMADFAQNVENVEKSPTSTQTTPIIPSNSLLAPTDDVIQVHTSIPALNISVLRPTTSSTYASSSHLPATGHQKSEPLCAIFESQSPKALPAHPPIVTALKTNPEMAGFIEKRQKIEYLPIYSKKSFNSSAPNVTKPENNVIQANANPTAPKMHSASASFIENYPKSKKSPILESFNWADDAGALPIIPTLDQHPPRDLSCLRSNSPHPFSSLQRRRGPKKRQYAQRHGYGHHGHWHHSLHPYTPSPSLNWDQDPRLHDLSNALKALGWFRH